jgi:hypothetical protein
MEVTRRNAAEQVNQFLQLLPRKGGENSFVSFLHGSIEASQQFQASGCNPAMHLASVGGAPCPFHETFPLEAIDHSRNPGRALDHPRGDGERGQPFRPGAAENS